VDSRFTTQAGIYEILEQADAVPGVFDVRIGRWLAWPAVKVLIYARLCNTLDAAPMAMPQARRVLTGASLFSRLPLTWLRLRSDLGQLPVSTRPRVAWLSGAYARRGPDGVEHDAIFGDLTSELTTDAEQIFLLPPVIAPAATGIHAEPIYQLATDLANQLTSLQRFRPAVRQAASTLAERLVAVTPTVAELTWDRVCLDALSMFEARRIAWTAVFGRIKPAVVLLTNAPYLAGEVAAAKASGAVVAEFQHGLFGPRCPEYGWPGALASRRDQMAVADRFYVFGDLFRGGALKNAFWRADDVRVIGSPEIERLRGRMARPTPNGGPPRIVFLTQPMMRAEALEFLDRYFRGIETGEFPAATVTIKVHPSEQGQLQEYAALAARYPKWCRIAGPADEAASVILEHDLAVSYTSYALIEAVGLGRAAVSISGRQAPGGVFALCPIPGASDAIPVVASPAELAAAASAFAAAGAQAGVGFFAPQPPGSMKRAVCELLQRIDKPEGLSPPARG
jgi:hypothetical protein